MTVDPDILRRGEDSGTCDHLKLDCISQDLLRNAVSYTLKKKKNGLAIYLELYATRLKTMLLGI